jgi:hypothetical protein
MQVDSRTRINDEKVSMHARVACSVPWVREVRSSRAAWTRCRSWHSGGRGAGRARRRTCRRRRARACPADAGSSRSPQRRPTRRRARAPRGRGRRACRGRGCSQLSRRRRRIPGRRARWW